ncbi:MAG: hypothetical protein H7321_07550 [Bacteroidia bacterium]|nr:hypothetical protein [Bacteroidia bacterium]
MKKQSSNIKQVMDNQNADIFLKPLESIVVADAPEFLFARIANAITFENSEKVSFSKSLLAYTGVCIVIILNFYFIKRSEKNNIKSINIVNELNISTDNSFYK